MLCLQAHYRSPIDVNEKTSTQASAALERLDALARRIRDLDTDVAADNATLEEFRRHMDDDLNTPRALAVVAETVTAINKALDAGDGATAAPLASAFRTMLGAVGLVVSDAQGDVGDDAEALCRARDEARAAKDWARADELRDELVGLGYVVEDTAQGTRVRTA